MVTQIEIFFFILIELISDYCLALSVKSFANQVDVYTKFVKLLHGFCSSFTPFLLAQNNIVVILRALEKSFKTWPGDCSQMSSRCGVIKWQLCLKLVFFHQTAGLAFDCLRITRHCQCVSIYPLNGLTFVNGATQGSHT